MKMIYTLAIRYIGVSLMLAVLLSGCAATTMGPHEQEGGITGTGNNIDCHDEKNKKRKECGGELP